MSKGSCCWNLLLRLLITALLLLTSFACGGDFSGGAEPWTGTGGIGSNGTTGGSSGAPSTGGVGASPLQQCPTPRFTLPGGKYNTLQTVVITVASPGCNVYYTLEGSKPTTASATYSKAIDLPEGKTTLKALAAGPGFADSSINSATYDITLELGQVAVPGFWPPGGTYPTAQSVTISSPTSGAEIHYTVDGSDPHAGSPAYSTTINLSTTTTIRALALKTGMKDSVISAATYTFLTKAAAPVFNPPEATYDKPQTVQLTTSTPGGRLFYTLDGSDPGGTCAEYVAPIVVSQTTTLKAITIASGYLDSAIATATYAIEPLQPQAATPTFAPAGGYYTTAQNVVIACTTPGATIHYTLDGTTPTAASTEYAGAIPVTSSLTLKAIAVAPGFSLSEVAAAVYTLSSPLQAATPVISPTPGPLYPPWQITITTSEPDGVILYTLDGTLPTATNGMVYSGVFTLNASTIVTAVTTATGKLDSDPAVATYLLWVDTPSVMPVTLTPGTTTATNDISVTLTIYNANTTICYTLDGSAPSCVATKDACKTGQYYPSFGAPPVIVHKTGTVLTAIACSPGYNDASLASAVYTLNTAPVEFFPPAGSFFPGTTITMASATVGAAIWYRTDGVDPTCGTGDMYVGPIPLTQDTEIRAVACKSDYGPTPPAVQTASYAVGAGE